MCGSTIQTSEAPTPKKKCRPSNKRIKLTKPAIANIGRGLSQLIRGVRRTQNVVNGECEMSTGLKVPPLVPVLAVEHVAEAVAFYTELGFSEVYSIPDESGEIVHAHLRKGDSVMFLGRLDVSHYPNHPRAETIKGSSARQRGIGTTLILQTEDLVADYELVQGKGLEILAAPTDEYYGDRAFFFVDPFGYEWKISQPIS